MDRRRLLGRHRDLAFLALAGDEFDRRHLLAVGLLAEAQEDRRGTAVELALDVEFAVADVAVLLQHGETHALVLR